MTCIDIVGKKKKQKYIPSIKIHFQDSAMFLAKVDLPIPCNIKWHKHIYEYKKKEPVFGWLVEIFMVYVYFVY